MTTYHAATVHPDGSAVYCGTVDQRHVDTVLLLADGSLTRHAVDSPRVPGALYVLRSDGALDHYHPVGEEDFAPAPPDPGMPPGDLPRGATPGVQWIGGALRLGGGAIGGTMDHPENPPRVVQHTTESPAGGRYLESVSLYLIAVGSEPQLVYCPVTDRIAQLGPLSQSARALRNDGARRTNREGRVCIQIEVLGRAAQPWTDGFDPAAKPGWQRILAALDSWSVPRVWPAGPPSAYPGGRKPRDRAVWQQQGGWFGHCDVPGNDHGDPGAIDVGKVPGSVDVPVKPPAPKPPTPTPAPKPADPDAYPGPNAFGPGADNPHVTRLGRMLTARGGARYYTAGPGPRWGTADQAATRAFQLAQGWTGTDADGLPGPSTWHLLVTRGGHDIPPPPPAVDLPRLIAAARADPAAAQGHTTYPQGVRLVEDALVAEGLLSRAYAGDGSYGTLTRGAYAEWQRRAGVGAPYDGIPGRASLTALGRRHGFTLAP